MAFTFFFRDRHSLQYLVDLIKNYSLGLRKIKIWCAGSASGQEPFTLAIILSETLSKEQFKKVVIFASDIDTNDTFGTIISEGIYHKRELSRMPEGIFEKYFESTDNPDYFRIISKIRDRVEFKKHNLLTLKPFETGWQAIVCKNVLLHFTNSEQSEVVKMFHNCLDYSGFFITEQTQQLPYECESLFSKSEHCTSVYSKV